MRVLSPHPGYSVQVFSGEESREADPVTGQVYTLTKRQPLVADFEAGHGLFPHEEELALRVFEWSGLTEGTNPVVRIGVYDTEAHARFKDWSPEYHEKVKERLRFLASQSPTRMVVVEDLKAPIPWGTYDQMDGDEILAYIDVLGLDPEVTRRYESENAQRADLLASLQDKIDTRSEAVATVSA